LSSIFVLDSRSHL